MTLLSMLLPKQSLFPRLRSAALFLTLSRLATSSPISDTGNLLLPEVVDATRPSCADIEQFPKWYQPSKKFDSGDCEKAISIFNEDYVQNHGGARYEYYNADHKPIHGIPTQRVPLKFGFGKANETPKSPTLAFPPIHRSALNQIETTRYLRRSNRNAQPIRLGRTPPRKPLPIRPLRHLLLSETLPGYPRDQHHMR